jgi:CTP synthase
MQLAVIEYARNVLKLVGASSAEIDPKSPHLVIDVMPEQKENLKEQKMGGTMRLGEYPAVLTKGSVARAAYKQDKISERHRHRYEVSPEYVDALKSGGIIFSGTSPDGRLMEIMELPTSQHPFFVGVQFHPEFHSRPLAPHPIFMAFIKAAKEAQKEK